MKFILTAIGIMIALSFQSPQQPKTVTITFTKEEAETLYTIIDESATPGQVRKPLLQKIGTAYSEAFNPKPQVDSPATKPVKKN